MDDDTIAQFTSITSASPERAQQYLTLSDGNIEQAIQLFFESGGVDMGGDPAATQRHAASSAPTAQASTEPIRVDSDDEDGGIPINQPQSTADDDETMAQKMHDDDEAMARRLQEEAYGAGGGGGLGGGGDVDVDPETGLRRPQARTHDTLAGPSASMGMGMGGIGYEDNEELQQAVRDQMMARQRRPLQRAGIFNQQPLASNSVWEDEEDPETRREQLSRTTGGASTSSSKNNRLADMYRPPFELMSQIVSWDGLRAAGKEEEKWILLNIQNSNVFDCQVLNRDLWKHDEIKQTIKENFIFKQYTREDPQATKYVQYYFKDFDNDDAYPHIAIVDPRTGEQVKVWSGPPAPKPTDFLGQLHEFLDRYSLHASARNPVAQRRPEKRTKEIEKMSEEEMLEMAMQNSMPGGKNGQKVDDPDTLTKENDSPAGANGDTNTSKAPKAPSPFDQISSSTPHTEPSADVPNTTRIQFRHPAGRVVRRFMLDDKVRQIYEWLKASPLETREGQPFELVFMGKNLMESIDATIEAAGLKQGSVMVEFVVE